jgi:hypothetical protein
MTLVRPFGLLVLLAGLTWGVSGCLTPPEYDIVPAIEFKEMAVKRGFEEGSPLPIDTFRITVSFRDGDGDLGLMPNEITKDVPYNYLIRLYRRTPPATDFEEYFVPPQGYFGIYPALFEGEYKPAPLKGDLTYRLELPLTAPLYPGDEVKFMVTIRDRALHESNAVETSIYKVPPK